MDKIMGGIMEPQNEYLQNEYTAAWTPDVTYCTKCGSGMAHMTGMDRCLKCGTAKQGEFVAVLPFDSSMKAQPQKRGKMIEAVCHDCGATYTKQKGSTRVLCQGCQKKVNNAKSNDEKYRKKYYNTNSTAVHTCLVCGKEIRAISTHYKERNGSGRICRSCYIEKYGRYAKQKKSSDCVQATV